MPTVRLSSLSTVVVVAAAAIFVAGCAGNGPHNIRPAVAEVPKGLELISFKAPGLSSDSVMRAEFKDNAQEEEYALFLGEGDAQAEVVSAEASFYSGGALGGDRHVLHFSKTTRDTLMMWNMSKVANLKLAETSFPYKGKLPYYLHPFERGDTGQSCVGFHAEFNVDPVDPQFRYDNHVFGYYCAPKGTKLSQDDMIAAVDGLDIAGLTTRASAAVSQRPFAQLTNDPQLVAAVKQGRPKGKTGIAAFPLEIVEIYSQNLGGSDNQP